MFDGDAPNYSAPTMGARDRSAIDTVVGGAMSSSPESMNEMYKPPAQGLMQDDSFNAGLSYQNPMSEAIKARTQRGFQNEQSKLNIEVKNTARNSYFDRLGKATDLAQQEQQMNFEKEIARRKAKQAKKQARGQAIGSVLGIVGGVVGAVYGGPMGAAAGSQVGGAVGNSIGQGMG